jgi:xanthine dehydrogenase accessory factor
MTDLTSARAAADRLRTERRPFVAATVVRAERPTSARAGDTAVILDDGTMIGFVGGECAEASVQVQALAALAAGEPRLLRITPDADPAATGSAASEAGAITVHNPCLSGGTLEIFLEPTVPPGLALVHGDAPIARAVRELAGWLGYQAAVYDASAEVPRDAAAVVVASHGRDEKAVLEAALRAGVPYVGLVASTRRAEGVIASLDVDEDERRRVSTPAGFDIGSETPQEVALSIMAEVVAGRPRRVERPSPPAPPPASGPQSVPEARAGGQVPTAVDPVCGMTVAAVEATRHLDHEGTRYWFCGPGCEESFRADPSAVLPQ